MAGSVSKELEELLNPLPVLADPEDNDDEATKARVVDRFTEEEEEEEEGPIRLSSLRRRNESLISDTDRRYVGKPVSRKELLKDLGGSGEEEEEEEEDDDEDEENSLDGDEEEEDDDDDEEEADGDEHDDDEDVTDVTLPKVTDFHKLTEGMDDLGMSEDDLEGSDDEDEDEASDDDDEEDEEMEEDEEGGVQTFSQDKVDQEVEKGKAVKNQLALWDQLLEGRIKIQKALVTANQLPQPDTLPAFKTGGGAEMAGALKTAHKALKALQRTLLELHDHLLYQNKDTQAVAGGVEDDDEEIDSDEGAEESVAAREVRPPKRKLEMAEYPDLMAKRFVAFKPYCNAMLQKWHDKTRLTTGKSNKGFGAFDRNILTQVEQVLMDKERLLRRTQTRRSEYRVLGKRDAPAAVTSSIADGEEAEGQTKANRHLKDLDEDIFDDDDFYHQLLRELIERKTSASDPNDQVAMGRQWLAIQKLRSKIKKKVDTKASKGRKVRFHIHSKLVNFMAPVDSSSMSDEARSELYRGLFGQNAAAAAAIRE